MEDFDVAVAVEAKEANSAIFAAFDSAMNDGKGEDDVKLEMIKAGATFKNVTRLYNQFMVESGRAVSKQEKESIIENTLGGLDFETEAGFDNAINALSDSLKVSKASAAATIRSYAKKHEKEVFAKEEEPKGTRNPFVTTFHKALIENPNFTEQDLRDHIAGLEPDHQVNPLRWFNQHNNIRIMVNNIAKKYGL